MGNLFILTDGSFVKYDGESITEFNLSSDVISGNICSFALNAVSDKVTFIASGEEVILGTDRLLNFSFEDFSSQVLFEQNEYIKNLSAINSSSPSTAFVTTTVNLYYLPVITESDDFAIEDVNNSLLKLRNGQLISPLYKINFYGVDFYLADITVNEDTIKGYIPVNFTTKVLSDDVISTTFTMEKVSETKVFADFELTSEVKKLSENEEVKVFEIKQGVATIGYLVDGEYVLGYISEDTIIKAPDTVIKNVVMVVALALCLVVTSLYFINKKKD